MCDLAARILLPLSPFTPAPGLIGCARFFEGLEEIWCRIPDEGVPDILGISDVWKNTEVHIDQMLFKDWSPRLWLIKVTERQYARMLHKRTL
ncbi:hypothetical protein ACFPLB_12585 [Aquamicrobium segne]|uniref:Uncharacterized protein n=1 Tax=Aquamicrobium segne TaxID=469547 RepID=A0ABW0GYR3_9HYPH